MVFERYMHACRNISLSGKLHIPEHAQLIVDCGGGAISLLAAPTLAYGSLLGFSQCMFTTFRPGESPTAKPSTPQYMFNWDADSALLLLEDSFLEQPCSVRPLLLRGFVEFHFVSETTMPMCCPSWRRYSTPSLHGA